MYEPKLVAGIITGAVFSVLAFWLDSHQEYGTDYVLPIQLRRYKFNYLKKIEGSDCQNVYCLDL